MFQTLDIFKRDLAGSLLWVEAVADAEAAKIRLRELAQSSPEKYIVFSQESQTCLGLEGEEESGKEFSAVNAVSADDSETIKQLIRSVRIYRHGRRLSESRGGASRRGATLVRQECENLALKDKYRMPNEQNFDAAVKSPKKRRGPRLPKKTTSAKRLSEQPIPKQPTEEQPTATVSW